MTIIIVRGEEVEPIVTPRRDQVGLRLRRLLGEHSHTEGYTIAQTEYPPGCTHLMHRHPLGEQGIFVLYGSLVLLRPDTEDVQLDCGDAAHIPAGEWHSVSNRGDEDAATLTVFANARPADAGYEEFESE